MGGFLKFIIGAIAVLVLLAVAVVAAVVILVDPDDYRELVANAVQEQTGRSLSIEGDFGLALMPCCGIKLGRSRLGNPPGFGDYDFARVESARLDLQIWPLITQQTAVIGGVELDGLALTLERRANGAANWEFDTGTPDAADKAKAKKGAAELPKLSIDGINVSNATVSFKDATAGLDYRVDNLNIKTGPVASGEPFDFESSFGLTDATDGTSGRISLKSGMSLDTEALQARFDGPEAQVELSGPKLEGGSLTASLSAKRADVTAAKKTQAAIRKLQAKAQITGGDLPADKIDLTANIQNLAIAANGTVRLTAAKFDATVAATGKELPGGAVDLTLNGGGLSYDVDAGTGEVQPFKGKAEAAGLKARFDGRGALTGDGPALSGTATVVPFSPRKLMRTLEEKPPETADPAVLAKLGGSANWRLGSDSVRLDKVDVKLDDTRLQGTARVINFDTPGLRFDLDVDQINLDRYLAPADENAAKKGKMETGPTEIPVELLRDLDVDGKLRIGKLTFNNARLTDVNATVKAEKGITKLAPISAKLYGGEFNGQIKLDVKGKKPRLTLSQRINKVKIDALLADMAEADELEGVFGAKLEGEGTGNTDQEIFKSLAGSVSANLRRGVYNGMDVWHEIRKARARIRREPVPELKGPPRTKIKTLEMAGKLSNGVLQSEKIIGEIPFIRLTGDGGLNFLEQNLDFRFQARVFETPTFPDGETLDDLTNLTLPLTVKGPIDSPKVGVELGGLAKSLATEKVREKVTEKLFDKLGGKESDKQESGEEPTEKEESTEDPLTKGLRDLLDR